MQKVHACLTNDDTIIYLEYRMLIKRCPLPHLENLSTL